MEPNRGRFSQHRYTKRRALILKVFAIIKIPLRRRCSLRLLRRTSRTRSNRAYVNLSSLERRHREAPHYYSTE